MYYIDAETLVDNIYKELDEAKRYNYGDFIVKQDLIKLIDEFSNRIEEDTYASAREEFELEKRLNNFD